jgi:hypothetical protein
MDGSTRIPEGPRLESFNTTASRTAQAPAADVPAPHMDSTARAITSIHDFRHTVADQGNNAPTYNSLGQARLPGKGSGVRITSEVAGPLASTASGLASDPFDRASPSKHRTRTELLAARRNAMRAPDSYDLGGDCVVDQKEYFYATKFDVNGDGSIDQAERETAAQLMKSAASNLIFLAPRAVTTHRNAFSRYNNAVVPGHNVVQVRGAIVSEQLEGTAALARSLLPGGGGPASALGATGTHLPHDVAEKVGEVLLTGTSGASRCRGVEVDMDTSDNVINLHLAGAKADFDRVQVKLGYRAELNASGSKLRSELLAKRKAARVPQLSYDVDGDGQVSARDFFFAARQDRTGTMALSHEARVKAAVEEGGGGLGKHFVEIRGDGAGQVGHRVQQREGAVLGENSSKGWAALTHARMHGSTLRVGLDGNLHHADGSPADEGGGATTMAEIDAASKSLLDDRDAAGLTINGRVAVEAVSGAVTDFDAISVKPHYRPHLAASGSKSRTDLLRFRAMGRRPDASFDLSNAGSVSHEDYQLAKRFDVGDKGYLTPLEHAAAQEALAGGLREKFTRMSTGSSRALTARTFQHADGTVECEGADTVEGDVGPREKYDATVRLPTAGIAPGLDLPPEVAAGTGKPTASRSADAHYLASSTATTLNVSLKGVDRTKPFVSTSIGAIPGVARAVVRFPDGHQEAFGGYAGGLGAGGATNVTAAPEVAIGDGSPSATRHRAQELAATTTAGFSDGILRASPRRPTSMDATAHGATDWDAPQPGGETLQTTLRPPLGINPEAPFRTHNQTTFCDPQARGVVFTQAPFALQGVGGTGDGVAAWSEDMEAQRSTAPTLGLRTASQLKAARKVRDAPLPTTTSTLPTNLGAFSNTAGALTLGTVAAGKPSDASLAAAIAVAAALPTNTLTLTATAAWLQRGSTISNAVALAEQGGASALPDAAGAGLSSSHSYSGPSAMLLPLHGATLKDEREAATMLPSGSPATLDKTGRGAYESGLDGFSTERARAAMPPLLFTGLAAAAKTARAITLTTPGSPLHNPLASPVAAPLPAYMHRTLSSGNHLRVDPQELSSDVLKPGALDETVRSMEATTRTALAAARKRDAKLEAREHYASRDDEGWGPGPLPALPELYTAHFNDSTVGTAGRSAVLPGAGAAAPLSKTRSALKQRLRHTAIMEALPNAPTDPPPGIHGVPLPSFARRLGSAQPWYRDGAAKSLPLDASKEDLTPARGVAGGYDSYTSVVSALDGPAPPLADPVAAALKNCPGNMDHIPPEYDAALRHTVRAPHLAGQRAESEEDAQAVGSATVTLARAAAGARNPRLIVDGLQREEEAVGAAGGTFDKVREVRPCDLGSWVRRRDFGIAKKVTEVDPQAPSEAQAHSASNVSVLPGSPAGGGGSGWAGHGSPKGPDGQPLPRLYEIHPNVTSLGTGLPGAPGWDEEPAVRATLMGNPFRLNDDRGNWAISQLEHAHRVEGDAVHGLDAEGKAAVSPRDIRPLYSSFSSDKAFMLPYVTPRGLALQPRSPSMKDLSAACAQVGGAARDGTSAPSVFRAMPSQGVPGPENPHPLLAALPRDREGRRGSVYGVEVVAGRAGGGRDVTVRGASRSAKWGGGGGGAASGGAPAAPVAPSPTPREGGAMPASAPTLASSARAAQVQGGGGSSAYASIRTGGFRD